jgi:hypothetical protein
MSPIEILLGVAFPLLFGTGVALITAGSGTGEFLAGRGCFILATIDIAALVVWWVYNGPNAALKLGLAGAIGVAVILGLPQLLKWVDSREAASIAERQAVVAKDAEQVGPLIDVIGTLQAQLKDQKEAEKIAQRILAQYDQLRRGIETFERFTGKTDDRDRVAAAEHIMKELKFAANNTVKIIDTPVGRGLVIKTAANTFRLTFPVPMRIAPDIIFQKLPAGATANVVEKSNIGFTVVFTPTTISVETIPPFMASAEF